MSSNDAVLISTSVVSKGGAAANVSLMKLGTFAQTLVGLFITGAVICATVTTIVLISTQVGASAPVAVDDYKTVNKMTPVDINVMYNDRDLKGGNITLHSYTNAFHGQVSISPNGKSLRYISNAYYAGPDSFNYTIVNSKSLKSSATVWITVDNLVPIAPDFHFTVSKASVDNTFDIFNTVQEQARIVDMDNDILLINDVGEAQSGDVHFNETHIMYTPYFGTVTDEFTYNITDRNSTVQAVIHITVNNDLPNPEPDNYILPKQKVAILNVLDNDSDLNGDNITLSGVGTCKGVVNIVGNTLVYQPLPDTQPYTDSMEYTITDGQGEAQSFVSIELINTVPETGNVTLEVVKNTEDNQVRLSLSDPDVLDTVKANILSGAQDLNGDVHLIVKAKTSAKFYADNWYDVDSSNYLISYTPRRGFVGEDTIAFQVTDGFDTANGYVFVTVTNTAPTAVADEAECHKNRNVTVNVVNNDSDINGDSIKLAEFTTKPTENGGVVTRFDDSNVLYTPKKGFLGTDSFEYTITDVQEDAQHALTSTAKVTITVVNDAPVAEDDSATVGRHLTVTVPVLDNDYDPNGDDIKIISVGSIVGSPTVQVTSVSNGKAIQVVGGDEVVQVTVQYTIEDVDGANATATLTIDVSNNKPVAEDDSVSVMWNHAVTIDVLNNDHDENGDDLHLSSFTQPLNGSVVIVNGTSFKYTPSTNFVGLDTFTYSISDGIAVSDNAATVSVHVGNNAPVAVADTGITHWNTPVLISVLDNDYDVDGDKLTIQSVSSPSASIETLSDGTQVVKFIPSTPGQSTFTYTITDGNSDATTSVSVESTNTPPVAQADSYTYHWDSPAQSLPVLANDNDADNDDLTIDRIVVPSDFKGQVTVAGDKKTLNFVPAKFVGVQTFTYFVSDGPSNTASAVVTINQINANVPQASSKNYNVHWSTQTLGNVVSVFTVPEPKDADGDKLVLSVEQLPAHGSAVAELSDNGVQQVRYTQSHDYLGADQFTIKVSDGYNSAIVTVSFTVYNTVPTCSPIVSNELWKAWQPSGITVDALSTSSDADEPDAVSLLSVSPKGVIAGKGTVSVSTDAGITFVPVAGFVGSVTLNLVISDGIQTCNTTYTATVRNNAPVASPVTTTAHWSKIKTGVLVDVLSQISDADSDSIVGLTILSQSNGTATVQGNDVQFIQATPAVGGASFTLQFSDGWETKSAVWKLTIVNSNPTAVDQAYTNHWRFASTLFSVLTNAQDTDSEDTVTLSSVASVASTQGTVSKSGNQALYVPKVGYVGSDSFKYTATDGLVSVTKNVAVTLTNTKPVPTNDARSLHWRLSSIAVDVLTNDNDGNSDPIHVNSYTQPTFGATTLSNDLITYTLTTPRTGLATFTYNINDVAQVSTTSATVSVDVTNANKPVTADETRRMHWRDFATSGATFSITNAVTDGDGDSLTLKDIVVSNNAFTVVQSTTGGIQVTLTGKNGWKSGTESVQYTLTDGCDSSSSRITLESYNNVPTATDYTIKLHWSMVQDGTYIDVLSTAQDADVQDKLLLTIQNIVGLDARSRDAGVTATVTNNKFFYKPKSGTTGTDSFSYDICDGLACATAHVSVTVESLTVSNADQLYSFHWSETKTVPKQFDLIAALNTGASTLVLTTISSVPNKGGSAQITGDSQSVTYTQANMFVGTEQFEVKYKDNLPDAQEQTIFVTVNVLDAIPTVQNKNLRLHRLAVQAGYPVDLLSGATDADTQDTVTIKSVTKTAQGAFAQTGSVVTYSPPSISFVGTSEKLDFVATDGVKDASGSLTIEVYNTPPTTYKKTATVHFTDITPAKNYKINVLTGDSTTTADNDKDDDGETLKVLSISSANPSGVVTLSLDAATGDVTIASVNGVIFVNNKFSFSYTVTDGASNGQVTQVVEITVTDTAPVAVDSSTTIHWKTTNFRINPLDNDSDADTGDDLTLVSVSSGITGSTVNVDATKKFFLYTPKSVWTGVDTITYVVTDGALTATAKVIVTVYNNAPVAATLSRSLQWSNSAVTTGIIFTAKSSSTDSDAGDSLTVTSVTGAPQGSTATIQANGDITFIPRRGFVGTTVLSFTVTDGQASSTGTITVEVKNQDPTSTTKTVSTHFRTTSLDIDLTSSFSDADGDAIVISSVSAGTYGTVAVKSGFVVTYTRTAAPAVGTDSFTVTYSDSWSASKTQTFTVSFVDNAPQVSDINVSGPHSRQLTIPITTRTDGLQAIDQDTADATFLTVVNSFSGTIPQGTTISTNGKNIVVTPVANSLSPITINYSVTDGAMSSSASVKITLTNTAPSVNPFSSNVHWTQTQLTQNALTGATDAEGDQMNLASATLASGSGTVTISGSTITFKPTAKTLGTNKINYVVSDGVSTSTGVWTVVVRDAAPTGASSSMNKRWTEKTFTIDLTSSISDADAEDSNNLSLTDIVGATLSSAKVLQFTRTVTASDIDTPVLVKYKVTDGVLKSDEYTISITYKDQAPVALSKQGTIAWNSQYTVDLSTLCSDADDTPFIGKINGVALSDISQLNSGSAQTTIKGQLSVVTGTTIKFVPNNPMTYPTTSTPQKSTVGTFTFTCEDGLLVSTNSVSVTVTNTAPTATGQPYSQQRVYGQRSYTITGFVPTTFKDADGDNLSLVQLQGATLSGSSAVVSVANDNIDSVQFSYQYYDGQLYSATATSTLSLTNVAPVCTNINGGTLNKGDSVTKVAQCTDANGDPLVLSVTSAPSMGTVEFSNGNIKYTAPLDQSATTVTFTFTATDIKGATGSATFTVSVNNRVPTSNVVTLNYVAYRNTNAYTIDYLTLSGAADADSYDNTRLKVAEIIADTCDSNAGTFTITNNQIVFNRVYTFSSGSCSFRVRVSDADKTNPKSVTNAVTMTFTTSGIVANGVTVTVKDADTYFTLTTQYITQNDNDPLGGTFQFAGWVYDTCTTAGFCREAAKPQPNGDQWQFTQKSVKCQADRIKYKIQSIQDPSIVAYGIVNILYTNCVCAVPLDVVFIFDSSGSVGSTNFQKIRDFGVELTKLYTFAGDTSDPNTMGTRIGAVRFSDSDKVTVISDMSNTKSTVVNAITAMEYDAGNTWILDAIRKAQTLLQTQGRPNVPNKVIITLFDGEPNGPCSCGACQSRYSGSTAAAKEAQCLSTRFPYRDCNACDLYNNFQLKCNPCSDIVPLCTQINSIRPDSNGNGQYWRVIPVGVGQALDNAVAQQLLNDMSFDPTKRFYVDWSQLNTIYQSISDQACNLVDTASTVPTLTVIEPNEPAQLKCGDIVSFRSVWWDSLYYEDYKQVTARLSVRLSQSDLNTASKPRSGFFQVVCPNNAYGTRVVYGTTQFGLWNLQNQKYMTLVTTNRNWANLVTVTASDLSAANSIWTAGNHAQNGSGKKVYYYNAMCLMNTAKTSSQALSGYTTNGDYYYFPTALAGVNGCTTTGYELFFFDVYKWSDINNKSGITVDTLPMSIPVSNQ
jgi:hypothetical protein